VLIVDLQHRLLEYVEMFHGTWSTGGIHASRKLVKEAPRRHAVVVLFH
jgi:DNA repair protein RadC